MRSSVLSGRGAPANVEGVGEQKLVASCYIGALGRAANHVEPIIPRVGPIVRWSEEPGRPKPREIQIARDPTTRPSRDEEGSGGLPSRSARATSI